MNMEHDTRAPNREPVAGLVERTVRPGPEAVGHLHSDGAFCQGRAVEQPVWWPVSLYTEDQLRAEVAAERERCAVIAEAATKEQRDSIAHLCPGGVCECRIAAAIRDPAAAGICPPTTAAAVCGA